MASAFIALFLIEINTFIFNYYLISYRIFIRVLITLYYLLIINLPKMVIKFIWFVRWLQTLYLPMYMAAQPLYCSTEQRNLSESPEHIVPHQHPKACVQPCHTARVYRGKTRAPSSQRRRGTTNKQTETPS